MVKRRHIKLTDEERAELEQLIKSGVHAARVICRARVFLLLDRGQGARRKLDDVAEEAIVSRRTMSKIKQRYFAGGLERALHDLPRPGAPPKIDGEVEARLIALACSDPPEGRERRTLRLLAEKLVSLELVDSISHAAAGEVLGRRDQALAGEVVV